MSGKDLVIFSIFTFVTVLLWTFLEAYHVYKTSTVPANLKVEVIQITPTLNKEIVSGLNNRMSGDSFPTPSISTVSSTVTTTLPTNVASSSGNNSTP